MLCYFEFLILKLPDMLSIDSNAVSEFGFINFSFIGAFFATSKNNNIKKIRTITSEMFLQIECFIIIFFQYFLIFYICFSIFNNSSDTTCRYKRRILFAKCPRMEWHPYCIDGLQTELMG